LINSTYLLNLLSFIHRTTMLMLRIDRKSLNYEDMHTFMLRMHYFLLILCKLIAFTYICEIYIILKIISIYGLILSFMKQQKAMLTFLPYSCPITWEKYQYANTPCDSIINLKIIWIFMSSTSNQIRGLATVPTIKEGMMVFHVYERFLGRIVSKIVNFIIMHLSSTPTLGISSN
jgi:hypothetical protein